MFRHSGQHRSSEPRSHGRCMGAHSQSRRMHSILTGSMQQAMVAAVVVGAATKHKGEVPVLAGLGVEAPHAPRRCETATGSAQGARTPTTPSGALV